MLAKGVSKTWQKFVKESSLYYSSFIQTFCTELYAQNFWCNEVIIYCLGFIQAFISKIAFIKPVQLSQYPIWRSFTSPFKIFVFWNSFVKFLSISHFPIRISASKFSLDQSDQFYWKPSNFSCCGHFSWKDAIWRD